MALRELFGLMGDPVEHSLSPEIQQAAFQRVARTSAYLPFRVPPERLGSAFDAARVLNLKGFNLTLPHKEAAARLVDALEGDAQAIGAVNVVVNKDGRLVGHNTDTAAVTAALEQHGARIDGARVLVLGAGGAARAAVFALGRAGAGEVVVANRTFRRAQALAMELGKVGIVALASPLTRAAMLEIVPESSIIVNATSVGLNDPSTSPLPLDVTIDSDATVLDLVYRPLKTRLLAQAREAGAQTVDGLDVLVNQGLGALSLWLGKRVDAAKLAPIMRAAALEALL